MLHYEFWDHAILFSLSAIVIVVFLTLVVLLVQDLTQTTHAIRHNFPLIGRLRYLLENLGEYFRQYFIAQDREELPFNRATRNWIYRTAKGGGGLIGFGSTNDLRQQGSILFVNASYPLLEEEFTKTPPIVIGKQCQQPFEAAYIFNISGMSYGALSKVAVTALAQGAKQTGIWMNTGEGGLSPYHQNAGCDLIFQIGTAKYGVRDEQGNLNDEKLREVSKYVKAFEIKLSQGAKPGRGGVLPASKVTEEIASIRGIALGKLSSSPNRHKEIRNSNDLLDMIARIREVTGRPVGIKTAIGSAAFPEDLCETILRRGIDCAPDFITVDGSEGGSGAAQQLLADHVALPISEALPIVVDALMAYGLKERICIIASGKLVHSAKVAWALCVGADFVVSARGFMFALGCVQSLQCHTDTCPTGVTTHNPWRQKGLVIEDKLKRVAQYAYWVNHEINVLAHSCGLSNARHFQREHIRIVQQAGKSLPLDELHPYRGIKHVSP